MDYFAAIVLAVVEGLTEFLPISSTGHLILTTELLKISKTDFVKSFEIIIQLGAIFAVIFLYWRRLILNSKVLNRILIAFLPSAILGFIFYSIIKNFFLENAIITLVALFGGGIILIILELLHKERDHYKNSIEQISLRNAFFIGVFQSIAMIPGVSRSAATIIGGLLLGAKRKTAVEFSFLLAIPTMLAASVFDVYKNNFFFTFDEYSLLAVGFIGSFIVAIFVIKFFLSYIQTHTFIPFGIYRIIIAIVFFLFILT